MVFLSITYIDLIRNSDCEEQSSSEEEFEEENVENEDNEPKRDSEVGLFVQWTVMFLTVWQSAYRISDAAMSALLKFIVMLLKVSVEKSTSALVGVILHRFSLYKNM